MSDTFKPDTIVVVGAGRMGHGIALSYAMAGVRTVLVDIKSREPEGWETLVQNTHDTLARELSFLAELSIIEDRQIASMLNLIDLVRGDGFNASEYDIACVFEAVPEYREAKADAFQFMSQAFSSSTVIASTTSTFLVDDLAQSISHPERYMNAHWLNPAHLMPLVEISRGSATSEGALSHLRRCLDYIGKLSVVCSSSPGYIVPRIQALAMNEAARLVEENVASAEDVDLAIRTGFGIRYAILGMLEFIDWGGGDILYYASDYLSGSVDADRYKTPEIIKRNMDEGKKGLADGQGFYDYRSLDVTQYRKERIGLFVHLLRHLQLVPSVKSD